MKCPPIILCLLFPICSAAWQSQQLIPDSAKTIRIIFHPKSFSNAFTLNLDPVMTIREGDTIETETIDAMGFDKAGTKRQRGGNPLTGPFYVEKALAGDLLAITLIKVSLNRNYAYTSQGFVARSMPDSILKSFGKRAPLVKWILDGKTGMARPDSPAFTHLREFNVPLNPFLGCIGVAPANNKNEILSFFQGDFGGNLDYHRVKQGCRVFLPVLHDGAFLYFGDGHALQGDGEIAGNALETSMDIVFTVAVIKNQPQIHSPRVIDSTWLMAIGVAKDLDEATKIAGGALLEWLMQDYSLELSEASQVLSSSIEYDIAEIADPNVEVVAKIRKKALQSLKKKSALPQ